MKPDRCPDHNLPKQVVAIMKSIDPRIKDLEYWVNREERKFLGEVRYAQHSFTGIVLFVLHLENSDFE